MGASKELTKGHPFKVMLHFSLPLFVSVVFQQFYSLADSMIAGVYAGEDALAAIGASYPVTMVFMSVCFGWNIGISIVTSRFFGASDDKKLCEAVKTALIASIVCSLVLTIAGLLSGKAMLGLLDTPENIFKDSSVYLNIYLLGFVFLFFYNVCNGIFTSMGDSLTPLLLLIASSVANVILDLLFVGRFHMGVAGAAWATFIAQGIVGVISFIVLLRRILRSYGAVFKSSRFSGKALGLLIRMSVPSILQQAFVSVGNLFIQSFVNSFESSVCAGYTAAIKLNTFAVNSSFTFGNAMSTYAGQNLGAGKIDRIKSGLRYNVIMNIVLAFLFSAAFLIFALPLISMFMDSEQSTLAIATGVDFIHIVAPFYVFMAVKLSSDGALRGMGKMNAFMISTFLDLLLRIVFSAVLKGPFKATGIWMSWPTGWIIGCVVSLLLCIRVLKRRFSEKM